MSKRGRSWKQKIKKKLGADKLASARIAIQARKKATNEQLQKIKKGFSSFIEIKETMKDFKKEYEKTGDKICKDKYERLEAIIKLLKKNRINEAKKLGHEYDRLYPDDF